MSDDIVAPSPRRGRKNKRYNGFSLESFNADEGGWASGIQIFTDNRDKVPEIGGNEANPFVEEPGAANGNHARKVAGGTKRRKISGESRKVDPQVAAATDQDEGMVYVL